MKRSVDKVATGVYLQSMRAVGLKTLKARLAEYVRIATSGETVLVTDRDRVVAELGPPRENRSLTIPDALLADAVRKGWITPPTVTTVEPPSGRPLLKLETLLEELDQDREER